MARSQIFYALVEGPDDVSGALAYVLYKNEKTAYITRFAEDHGREPSDTDLAEFHRMTNLPDRLEAYRNRADALLETFLENALATELLTYKQDIKNDATVKAVEQMHRAQAAAGEATIRAVKTSFWSGVGQNITAGIVTTLMTFGFVMAAWMYDEGAGNILKRAFDRFNNGASTSAPGN